MKRLVLIGLGICLFLFISSSSFAYDNGDWQFWNTYNIAGNLSDKWKMGLEAEYRFGDNIRELYYQHSDLGFTYKAIDWFSMGINYRQVFELSSGVWTKENRPHFNGTFKWTMFNAKFEDRSRFELRIRAGRDNVWRYRNKLSLAFPVKWTQFNIQPYISDEIFVDFEGAGLNRNRLYAGAKASLLEHLSTDVFYLWQASKSGDAWPGINVIGLKFKAAF